MIDGATSAAFDFDNIGDGLVSSFEQKRGTTAATDGNELGAHWSTFRESVTFSHACESEPGEMLSIGASDGCERQLSPVAWSAQTLRPPGN